MQVYMVKLIMNGNYTHQVGDSGCLWGKERVKYFVDVYVSLEHFFLNTFIYFFKFQYN